MKKEGLTADGVEKLLNSESGLYGVSGVSSDCRDVLAGKDAGDKRAGLAIDILIHYIKKIIGSYIAEMNGIDALVFTAGIGENDGIIREMICENMSYLGIEIDSEINLNAKRGTEVEITKPGAKVRTFAIPTNEEYMIALDTYELVK
jgi:acetate kinase